MAEVGVCEDEAGGGRVLDSRPDKLLDRELWASCRGLDACPEFLLPPKAVEIFPEVLQSPKLSLFQPLEGKTFLALSKSSEFDFVEDKFIRFVRTSEEERVWVSEGADVLVEVCEGLKEIFESSVFLELVSVCLFAGSLSMAGVVVERGLDDLRVSELTVRARDGNAPPEVLKFGPSAVLPFVEHAGGVHCLVVTDPEEGLVEKPTLLGSVLVVDFENVGKDFEDGEVEEEAREEKEEEEDESEESTSSSSTTSPSSPLWGITVRFLKNQKTVFFINEKQKRIGIFTLGTCCPS